MYKIVECKEEFDPDIEAPSYEELHPPACRICDAKGFLVPNNLQQAQQFNAILQSDSPNSLDSSSVQPPSNQSTQFTADFLADIDNEE